MSYVKSFQIDNGNKSVYNGGKRKEAFPIKKLPAEILLYMQAYSAFRHLTPIAADCGELCSRRCCQGDAETGMLLFPHEELLLQNAGYHFISQEMQGRSVLMAICDGKCERRLRPLSCRIFPYAPLLRNGDIQIEPDPRARPICPLLQPEAAAYIQPEFLQTMKTVYSSMLQSPKIRRFLADYTAMLDEYRKFTA